MSSITLNITINLDINMLRNLLEAKDAVEKGNASLPITIKSESINLTKLESKVVEPLASIPEEESAPPVELAEALAPAPAPSPVALITDERKPVRWAKKNIILASEEQIALISNRIEMGELTSPNVIYNWYTKYNPQKYWGLRIVNVLRNAPNRSLSFQSLVAQTGLPSTGNDNIQAHLREMDKQGIITYSPKD